MPIRITAKQEGFRRCGQPHSCTPVEYTDDHFSREQLAELQAEKMLVVEIIKSEPPRPNAGDAIALVKGTETIAALDELATGEDRKSVLAAIAARRTELAPAE